MFKSRILAILGAVVFGLSLGTPAALAADPDFYAKVDYLSWKEFNTSGEEIMHEKGPIYTLGKKWQSSTDFGLTNTTKFEVFGGATTHYESAIVNTKNNYYGFKIDTEWSQPSDGGIEPFAGLGWKRWTRSIDTTVYNSIYVVGYTENWSSVYSKAGIRQNTGTLFWEAGVKYPLLNNNRVDFSGVSHKPKNAPGLFAEIGINSNDCQFSLTYEYQKYNASDADYSSVFGGYYYQPTSKEQYIGFKAAFKL
ncbi:MAG: hypothetical protein H6Q73_3261 [Firmicutes bacterium]|nr:hypothetical protein [Bacillota bacterium]